MSNGFSVKAGCASFDLGTICGVALVFVNLTWSASAAEFKNLDSSGIREAIQAGGTVNLMFDGIVAPTRTFQIHSDTVVDATGYSVVMDAGNLVRHFSVTNGARRRLVNLTLVNGRSQGADGKTNEPGHPALGGAILCSGGVVELTNCKFFNNSAVAGNGGPSTAFQPPTQGGSAYGGAIFASEGQLLITNCAFFGNVSVGGIGGISDSQTGGGGDAFGGAICSTNSQLVLNGGLLTNNVAKAGEIMFGQQFHGGGRAYGGALAQLGTNQTTIRVKDSAFKANRVEGATNIENDQYGRSSANGGALFSRGSIMTITETIFENNTAQGGTGGGSPAAIRIIAGPAKGGGLMHESGNLTLENCAFVSNTAAGGVATCCGFVDSAAGSASGGAIFNMAELTVINCTLAANTAKGGPAMASSAAGGSAYGGAIFADGNVSLLNATLASNLVEPGSASAIRSTEALGSSIFVSDGIFALTNTILFTAPNQTNVVGKIKDGGYNLSSDSTPTFTSDSSRSDLDPMLGDLGDNGGTTPTLPLLPGSPAIDATSADSCPPGDQRGQARPIGRTCDIGAYEFTPRPLERV